MSADARTIAVYDAKAPDYDDRFRTVKPDRHLRAFVEALPQGAHVLDLGCGPANASAFLRAAGMVPDPVDASPAMVALANQRHGVGARLGTFDDIDAVGAYDGVWANFSLLHAARADLPRHLAALHRALKAGGLFHIGMKTGTGEARDALDRFYTYVGREELLGLLEAAGFTVIFEAEGTEVGLAGTSDPFLILRARACAAVDRAGSGT
ncbi:class I SAM-dependent DNA methyltransferase [Defluviimonas sp. SAOS-178_SWC]|uniref:class I SAM-dependent DNA methyltransferase n=1 Tax=Defluviimonas sp. SAOS-178_SWC TaxID=3121287 RepID=UPI0032217847